MITKHRRDISLQTPFPDISPTLVGGSDNPRSHGKQNGSDRGALVCITGGVTHTLTSEGADASEDGTGRGIPIVAQTAICHSRALEMGPPNGPAHALAGAEGGSSKRFVCFSDEEAVLGVRRLTPLECERLQGFSDGYTDGQSDAQRYRQLGNAVAVPVVEWIAKRLVEVDKLGRDT